MLDDKLYTKCGACDGHGSRKFEAEDFTHQLNFPPPFCVVCDGTGFVESGLRERQIELISKKIDRLERKNQELIQLIMKSDKAKDYQASVQKVGGCQHCGGAMCFGQNIVYCLSCGSDGNPTKLKY